jgi:hypothetical protein
MSHVQHISRQNVGKLKSPRTPTVANRLLLFYIVSKLYLINLGRIVHFEFDRIKRDNNTLMLVHKALILD